MRTRSLPSSARCNACSCFHTRLHRALFPRAPFAPSRRNSPPFIQRSATPRDTAELPAQQENVALEEVKLSYATFAYGEGMQFFIAELPDGRLNVREVFLLGEGNPDRIKPTIRGHIEEEPAFYQAMPVEAFFSGDSMHMIQEKYELEHLLLIKVHCQDPYELDFRSVYCFDCRRQEFYRAQPLNARRDEIVEPVLRFIPESRLFLIDDNAKMPPPHRVVDAADAIDEGVDFVLDPEVDEVLAQARRSGSGAYSQAPRERRENKDDEPKDDEPSISEFDEAPDESPDVPAVDMA